MRFVFPPLTTVMRARAPTDDDATRNSGLRKRYRHIIPKILERERIGT